MEVASSACNGDCSSKQSRARQVPNLMDKDGGALMIHPSSLQLELKLSWLAETELEERNIDEAKSRRGLNVKGATRDADDACDDMKPTSSTSHSMTAERGFERCRNGGRGEGGKGGKKLRLSKEQSSYLEERFKEHTTLNPVGFIKICIRKYYIFYYFIWLFFFFFLLLPLFPCFVGLVWRLDWNSENISDFFFLDFPFIENKWVNPWDSFHEQRNEFLGFPCEIYNKSLLSSIHLSVLLSSHWIRACSHLSFTPNPHLP